MSTVKEHYDNHLGHFYTWMQGDFEVNRQAQEVFFRLHGIIPLDNRHAIDLGCGAGIQSIALAHLGFSVTAIDFNKILLEELQARKKKLNIEIIRRDILDVTISHKPRPELVVCMGDTLTHLPNRSSVQALIHQYASNLVAGGKMILSYRDLSNELTGTQRFIPVRSSRDRIHTCFLEYFDRHVIVTDILHEQVHGQWTMKASAYPKLKLPKALVKSFLDEGNLTTVGDHPSEGMEYLIAQKVNSN